MAPRSKTIIGWEEWCALPALELPAVKVKVDTGAKTSALHAYDIEVFVKDKIKWVRFKIHPVQGNNKIVRSCVAPLVDRRGVTSSNGEREKRCVVKTPIEFNNIRVDAEVTLTSRHNMAFRMLLGRDALRKAKFIVDPTKSYLLGKKKNTEELYQHHLTQEGKI